MKFTTPLLGAAMLASSVQACIRLHVLTGYNPLVGDGGGMKVQIWDNDNYYDVQRQSISGANGETHWKFNFANGYFAELWDNGYSGYITAPGGWRADLTLRLKQCEINCYASGENNCRISGTNYESALDDNFGNCDVYGGAQLCNWAECVNWHDPGWSNGDDGKCKKNW